MNREYATEIIKKLLFWGVEEFYVCAGARDFPLIEAVCSIESDHKIVFNHFEERSAAFYALGRIKSLKKPIAIITTSGTAVGELLPATMESYYSGLPLVLLTADRPKSYRNTGAPQSAEHKNIFGIYVSKSFDLEVNDTIHLDDIPKNRPVHINVCFPMPLQSGQLTTIKKIVASASQQSNKVTNTQNLELFLEKNKKTFVIVSQIFKQDKSTIIKFIQDLNCPVYIESISNLRECSELNHLKIKCGNKIWENSNKSGYEFDSVIKIGGTPTHRFWRDLDETQKHISVFSISELPFSGMPDAQHLTIDYDNFVPNIPRKNSNSIQMKKFLELDNISYSNMCDLFICYPEAEQSLYFYLSALIQENSRVYLGNSLPIRYWDLAAKFENKNFYIDASRGLNGIDGQISSFLGFADEQSPENWGIFGDLTTLYDLASLWVLQHRKNLNVNIVIVNNGGGRIFNQVLKGDISTLCQNIHELNFEHFAKFWGLEYEKVTNIAQIKPYHKCRIIEIVPNAVQTEELQNLL
ncbi:MAG: 2-succinyl-5-enolpyruvyl-6-hydroxy-3-cyclohexene-1-carboxylic-acid synthase [Bdellovibrionota bacterium]